jgi:uncharacterized protein
MTQPPYPPGPGYPPPGRPPSGGMPPGYGGPPPSGGRPGYGGPGYGGQPGYGPQPGYGGQPGPRPPYGAPLPPAGYRGGPQQLPPLPPAGYYGRPPSGGGGGAGAIVAILTVLVVLSMVGGLVVFAAAASSKDASSSAETTIPSFTYPSTPSTETAAATTTPGSTRSTNTAGPQAVDKLADNPLFTDAGLQNFKCPLPHWASDVSSVRKYFQTAQTCLDNMWKPLLQAANLPFDSPKLSVTEDGTSSACGTSSGNYAAFYCSADNTMYMPLKQLFINEDPNGDPAIYLAVFAHEYGHHVQALSGVMDAENEKLNDLGLDSDEGLEYSRRLELEAQCFSGMFIGAEQAAGAVTASQGSGASKDNSERGDAPGDMRTHGTANHYGAWWNTGYKNNRTQRCNTWTAASSDVG